MNHFNITQTQNLYFNSTSLCYTKAYMKQNYNNQLTYEEDQANN